MSALLDPRGALYSVRGGTLTTDDEAEDDGLPLTPMEERIMKSILHLLRKEKPVPGPRPPARPPSPGGIRTPGGGNHPNGGMVCPGTGN